MTENPLRGSSDRVNSLGLPYSPSRIPTSTSDLRVRVLLFVVWLVMLVPGLMYVSRYALINPYVDEWAFVPVLFGDEPAGPWLWELHNEHRFPLPRVIYLGLFRLTGDLRAGCYVSLTGISLVSAGLMRLARVIRGRASMSDAVFPLLLMHTGQGENLYMGYQLAFMLTTALAAALLAVMVRTRVDFLPPLRFGEGGRGGEVFESTSPPSPLSEAERGSRTKREICPRLFRSGLEATTLGWLLLTCGAAGLVYGIATAVWVLFLAIRAPMSRRHRAILIAVTTITPIYLAAYFNGYKRPAHHPPSAGIFESIRVGLEAQAMALGPAATGIWPIIGIAILAIAAIVVAQLLVLARRGDLRFVGLLLFIGAGAAVAFGIGWGRSGFRDDKGFAWRYGWITVPPIFAAYFTWLLRGGRVSSCGPAVLVLLAAGFAPINTISGFRDAEAVVRSRELSWESDVRSGMTANEVVARHFPNYSAELKAETADAMRRMRDHRYAYYESLGREQP